MTAVIYRGHYVPVAERPYPFLAAVDVFQLGFVCGTKAENPSSIVVHFEREGEDHSHFLRLQCHVQRTIVP